MAKKEKELASSKKKAKPAKTDAKTTEKQLDLKEVFQSENKTTVDTKTIKVEKPAPVINKDFVETQVITMADLDETKHRTREELENFAFDKISHVKISDYVPEVDIENDPYVELSLIVKGILEHTSVITNEYGEAWIVLNVEDSVKINEYLDKNKLRVGEVKMIAFVLNRRVYDYLNAIARINKLPIMFIYYGEESNFWKMGNVGELLVTEQIARKLNLHLFIFVENNIADNRMLNSLGDNFRYKPERTTSVLLNDKGSTGMTGIETNIINVLRKINNDLVEEYLGYLIQSRTEESYEVKRIIVANIERCLKQLHKEFMRYAHHNQKDLIINPDFKLLSANLASFIAKNAFTLS